MNFFAFCTIRHTPRFKMTSPGFELGTFCGFLMLFVTRLRYKLRINEIFVRLTTFRRAFGATLSKFTYMHDVGEFGRGSTLLQTLLISKTECQLSTVADEDAVQERSIASPSATIWSPPTYRGRITDIQFLTPFPFPFLSCFCVRLFLPLPFPFPFLSFV